MLSWNVVSPKDFDGPCLGTSGLAGSLEQNTPTPMLPNFDGQIASYVIVSYQAILAMVSLLV